MAYSPKVIDHYENPRNVGNFGSTAEVKGRNDVGVGVVGASDPAAELAETEIKLSALLSLLAD